MYRLFLSVTLALIGLLAGCSQNAGPVSSADAASLAAPTALPAVIVYKDEACTCCSAWAEHMQRAGFSVEAHNLDNMNAIKTEVGIPVGKGSCHTAKVGRYFIEGHVPADDVKRLLAEHPDAKGLTVPGMVIGSPGMEMPTVKAQPYDVLLVANDGTTSVYAHH